MPRNYKKKIGGRSYGYTEDQMEAALQAVFAGKTFRQAAKENSIKERTLANKFYGRHGKKAGGQTVLNEKEEKIIVKSLITCSEFGMPLDLLEIRLITKGYLDSLGRTVPKFKGNLPGEDWINGFLARHKSDLTHRMCQNLTNAKAKVGAEEIREYFDNLKVTLEGVPPENIVNYDETNFTDDPGSKKMVFRRGVKYPERIMNSTKASVSVMFSGTASGSILPPYVVHKAENIYSSWTENGPPGTRVGRSRSGWFDASNFEDWFMTIAVPWARRKQGLKVMIGDNLSSHLNITVVKKCQELNIRFALLPPNTTHICQPLDVAYFAPMKRIWRATISDWKIKNPSKKAVDKTQFLPLLKNAINKLGNNACANIISGFRSCGISPFNPEKVLSKLPGSERINESHEEVFSESLLSFLRTSRSSSASRGRGRGRGRRLNVRPGASVQIRDEEDEDNAFTFMLRKPRNKKPSSRGRGRGRVVGGD